MCTLSLSLSLSIYLSMRLRSSPGLPHCTRQRSPKPRLPASCLSEGRVSYLPFQALDLPRRERQTSGQSCRAGVIEQAPLATVIV
ncbi:hypothetical protein F5883DRAFT_532563 [Diaporthe sp. PMI_573]|nr:hypothetical protein F5883DRAFT_532563 [Diaporthaceae sp. PMI_573]